MTEVKKGEVPGCRAENPRPGLERKREYGEKGYRFSKAADRRRQGDPGSSGRPGPWPGADQHNEFCKQFNARTSAKELEGLIIPVVISVYSDRSFTFITKTPPASILLKRAAGIAKGSGAPNKDKVGKVTLKQVEDIAKQKMPDLNAASLEAAINSVKGTARSMGIDVV